MKDSDFCKRLVALRESRMLTVAQIGERTGLEPIIIFHYEKGDRQPGLQAIKALCRALCCTASELIGV
jgi:transcriptional regulator with XRE-family HTH domain